MFTDDDYRDLVLDHFAESIDAEEGVTDSELLERYHTMLAALLDGYRWGNVISDDECFGTLFTELDDGTAQKENGLHIYAGIFMGGTLFCYRDNDGDRLHFTINDPDGSHDGKVVSAKVSDPYDDGQRRLLLHMSTVLECPLEEEQ